MRATRTEICEAAATPVRYSRSTAWRGILFAVDRLSQKVTVLHPPKHHGHAAGRSHVAADDLPIIQVRLGDDKADIRAFDEAVA